MLNKILNHLHDLLQEFPKKDSIIFNNDFHEIDPNKFSSLNSASGKRIAFVDGGQAAIIEAGNLSLSFIRVFAQVFAGLKKKESYKQEFYLLTAARWIDNELFYESKIFSAGEPLINPDDLLISSNDNSLKEGKERGAIGKTANIARRLAELSLASKISADYVVIDGTLQSTFPGEEKYLSLLKENTCSLAKSSLLFTKSGNSPVVLLNKIGPSGCWYYQLDSRTGFVKLHPRSKHVFRFEGDKEALPFFLEHCDDSLLLGYPYGLIFADKMARVSNQEKKALQMKILFSKESKDILEYLSTNDVHSYLDMMG